MRLLSAELTNFRNLSQARVDFGNTNFIVGDNAQGKTNILEALHCLSMGNSFKTHREEWLIKKGELFSRVSGAFNYGDGREVTMEVVWERAEEVVHKQFKLNGAKVSRKQLLGNLLTVIFSPDDVSLLRLQPAQRRGWLDGVITKTNKVYYADLLDYTKALKQRNQLLMMVKLGRGELSEVDVWDDKLSQLGSKIVQTRLGIIERLNQTIKPFFQHLAATDQEFSLVYTADPRFIAPEIYKQKLFSIRAIDIKSGHTNFGPHRDDLLLLLNGWDARNTASQGEFRLMVLALKLAEGEYIYQRFAETPIYLMDDVFSELDPHKSRGLIKFLSGAQTIYTATDQRFVAPGATVIQIEQGQVKTNHYEFAETR